MYNCECSTKNVWTIYLGTLHMGVNLLHLILSGTKTT
jgi:hypothetical protein